MTEERTVRRSGTGRRHALRACLAVAGGLILTLGAVADAAPALAAAPFVIEPAPTPALPHGGGFGAVDCPTVDQCWATVTATLGRDPEPSQLAHWSGGSWTLVDTPAPANDIDCVTPNDCWALGTTAEHWDGTTWTSVGFPTGVSVAAVSCRTTARCKAVGSQRDVNGHSVPAFLTWNGITWTTERPPAQNKTNVNFTDVSCPAIKYCWAVGYASTTGTPFIVYAHWDGTRWTYQPTNQDTDRLTAISCRTAHSCEAVGGMDQHTGAPLPITTHWDGTTWGDALIQQFDPADAVLSAVTCLAASNCWAAGYQDPGAPVFRSTLIEHWDGTSWHVVTAPDPGARAELTGISCRASAGSSICKAIGYRNINGDYFQDNTLVESRSG